MGPRPPDRRGHPPRAAMEPGLGDREWRDRGPERGVVGGPQWSPVLETGNGAVFEAERNGVGLPQWSPVLETGNGPHPCRSRAASTRRRNGARSWRPGMGPAGRCSEGWPRCRNGARSWRPGMAVSALRPRGARQRAAMEPGLGDREWWDTAGLRHRAGQAAMEPGLGDREWRYDPTDLHGDSTEPQWSPVLETGNAAARSATRARRPASRRNGARSWRPGMAARPARLDGPGAWCRNGARSWRPGMASAAPSSPATV